jgi:hypothetical protein
VAQDVNLPKRQKEFPDNRVCHSSHHGRGWRLRERVGARV